MIMKDTKNKKKIKIPESFEEINRNPIYKPTLEYIRGAELFEQEDERESEELKNALAKLNESIDSDIISESMIAQLYENIKKIYDRMLWIYSKNVKLANDKIKEMVDMANKYYVTRQVYNEDIEELEKKNIKDLDKLRKQKDEEIERLKDSYEKIKEENKENETIEEDEENEIPEKNEEEEPPTKEEEEEDNEYEEEDGFKDFETKFEEELAA